MPFASSWDNKAEPVQRKANPNRVMSLDLNPNRIGIAVLEQKDKECKPLHWAFYDYPELNRKLKLASDHPDSLHQRNKSVYELSCIAKEVVALADHFQCGTVVTEHLNIGTEDHGKGRSFNRAVNNQWTRKGFILPLVRRLEMPASSMWKSTQRTARRLATCSGAGQCSFPIRPARPSRSADDFFKVTRKAPGAKMAQTDGRKNARRKRRKTPRPARSGSGSGINFNPNLAIHPDARCLP